MYTQTGCLDVKHNTEYLEDTAFKYDACNTHRLAIM